MFAEVTIFALAIAAPWYERPSCEEANQLLLATNFDAAEQKIKTLQGSTDAEDQACAVWLQATMGEAKIAVYGKTGPMLAAREKALLMMYGFAKSHAKASAHFADLELEARIRRVRALIDAGNRSEALKEIRNVHGQLADRRGPPSPTLLYVRGIANMAVSQSQWALRTLMNMAGLDGDAKVGREALHTLFEGKTVYRTDARYLMRYFAEASPSPENGTAAEYSKFLRDAYPTNPQFAYDYARDLQRADRCKDAVQSLAPMREALEKDAQRWSNVVRAKVYWLSGRCSFDTGDNAAARSYVEVAAKQNFEELQDEIDKLKSDAKN